MSVTGLKSPNAAGWYWKTDKPKSPKEFRDRYSTKASTKIAYWDNGFHWKDVLFVEEVLYQNKNGEYFLYCYGGASTRFARINEKHLRSGSDKIIPLTEKEAVNWLVERLGEEARGLIEDEEDIATSEEDVVAYHLPAAVNQKIQQLAEARSLSPEEVIITGISLLELQDASPSIEDTTDKSRKP